MDFAVTSQLAQALHGHGLHVAVKALPVQGLRAAIEALPGQGLRTAIGAQLAPGPSCVSSLLTSALPVRGLPRSASSNTSRSELQQGHLPEVAAYGGAVPAVALMLPAGLSAPWLPHLLDHCSHDHRLRHHHRGVALRCCPWSLHLPEVPAYQALPLPGLPALLMLK